MQLTTEKTVSRTTVSLTSILYQLFIITAYDIFPSQYRPGKEAIRITAWMEINDEFTEIDIVTEAKMIINTLKENFLMVGKTYETMVIRNPRTGQYEFSKITKEQQKHLISKLNENRQQYSESNISGLSGEQRNVSNRPF